MALRQLLLPVFLAVHGIPLFACAVRVVVIAWQATSVTLTAAGVLIVSSNYGLLTQRDFEVRCRIVCGFDSGVLCLNSSSTTCPVDVNMSRCWCR